MSAKQSIYIDAPVEKVFDFCADPRKSWSTGPERFAGSELVDVRMSDKGVGSYYSWSMKIAGLRMEGFDVYTEYVPNERITDRCSMSFAGTWTYIFEPEGSGTRLTMQRHPASVWRLAPVDWLVDRLLVAAMTKETLGKAKTALEAAAVRIPAPAAPADETTPTLPPR